MISSEDIRKKIMEMAETNTQRTALPLDEVARQLSSDNWKNSIAQIKLVVDAMVREGKISSIQDNSFIVQHGKKPVL
jgi:Protein of unknown function (DUF3253)